jgi:hypothetical protein
MSNLINYAESELSRIGMGADTTDEMNKAMHDHIITMVKAFSDEGHSGMSAGYALSILKKVLAYEPLTPLTGEDSEWTEVGGGVFQNKRCSRVFKHADRFDGQAYDINGKVFVDEGGAAYTSSDSRVPVTFPYTPITEYVEVKA